MLFHDPACTRPMTREYACQHCGLDNVSTVDPAEATMAIRSTREVVQLYLSEVEQVTVRTVLEVCLTGLASLTKAPCCLLDQAMSPLFQFLGLGFQPRELDSASSYQVTLDQQNQASVILEMLFEGLARATGLSVSLFENRAEALLGLFGYGDDSLDESDLPLLLAAMAD